MTLPAGAPVQVSGIEEFTDRLHAEDRPRVWQKLQGLMNRRKAMHLGKECGGGLRLHGRYSIGRDIRHDPIARFEYRSNLRARVQL